MREFVIADFEMYDFFYPTIHYLIADFEILRLGNFCFRDHPAHYQFFHRINYFKFLPDYR